MTLEDHVAQVNGAAFWKEFTFAENKFAPKPGQELELADNLVWFGDFAIALQLKERETPTEDADTEASWFKKKVLDKATSQVRDTLRFLDEEPQISITNERGQAFDIRRVDLVDILKIVVFQPGKALPDDLALKRFHVSRTAGFIHLLDIDDYRGVLHTLRVPEDIRRYFVYREQVAGKIADPAVIEPDIMGAFIAEAVVPEAGMREILRRLVQDYDAFDLSMLVGNLHDHIEKDDQPLAYYRIMLQFAVVPRSVWRAIKERFLLSLEAAKAGKFEMPYRLTFPGSQCTFMITPLHPDIPKDEPEREKARVTGLRNLTHLAMYDHKSPKGVGIQVGYEGEHVTIDWCLIEQTWAQDPEMDATLAERSPFRAASEKRMDSFFVVNRG
ncbi:MAG: hypothetical protein MH112_03955 [Phenylobacterium sp.]|uniref:hypothetical protein n=1 Tax=Phenylobacterium sp. TaxID=1871053 RepID=UPI0025DA0891|nr:hypothetical protein [Phenylobacterium sp.]MCG9915501.1 hypothetical protein [Phenylobacterium sp.]